MPFTPPDAPKFASDQIATLSEAVLALRQARRVAVLTGAGISAESGIPTFRDPQAGIWLHTNPQDIASPIAFARDPARVWAWYRSRRAAMLAARPNAGHLALVALQRHVPVFTILTQNIDGLHQLAGSRDVVELHGSIHRLRCVNEDRVVGVWADAPVSPSDRDTPELDHFPRLEPDAAGLPPPCPNCGGRLRPDVVWFGEALVDDMIDAAVDAARQCDLYMSIGTSAVVEPAARLADIVLRRRRPVLEVNPEWTPLSPHAHYVLRGPAGTVLPALVGVAFPIAL